MKKNKEGLFRRIAEYFKSVFEFDTLLYIILCIAIPFIILKVANIFPADKVTLVFMLVIVGMYFMTVILICPILETNRQLRILLKETHKCTSYKKLSEIIKQKKYYKIRETFLDYEKNIKIKVDSEGQEKVYSEVDASYYIDEENLVTNDLKTKTIDQLSQTFTGVGIFGTFLGIVRGVSSLDVTNTAAMKDGIAMLLSGVKVSFNSSLYGILASAVIIVIYKILLDMTNTKINMLAKKIDSLVLPDINEADDVSEDMQLLKNQVNKLTIQNKQLLQLLQSKKSYEL